MGEETQEIIEMPVRSGTIFGNAEFEAALKVIEGGKSVRFKHTYKQDEVIVDRKRALEILTPEAISARIEDVTIQANSEIARIQTVAQEKSARLENVSQILKNADSPPQMSGK